MATSPHRPALRRSLRTLATVASLAVAVVPLGAQARTTAVPHAYRSALSPAQIAALSANASQRVIILLRNQHAEVTAARGSQSRRAAALHADQAPIVSELRSLHAARVHQYSVLNALAATISQAEADRLASDPSISAVVPDRMVSGPTNAVAPAVNGTAQPASAASLSSTPAAGVCPTNPANPLLEPEALQLMKVDNPSGITSPTAHSLGFMGTGVKVAIFPDGLDPNIPDFIRADGTHAIFDYVDFTGEGLGATTSGEEAFGDASDLIAQGTHVYDLSAEVNPTHPLPAGCTIRIEGVAPDASVAVMKVFGTRNFAFDSEILTAMEYAITTDHVDVLSQSFGANPVPNPGTDPIAMLDSQAVAAGITVVASTGDAGTSNTIGSPADVPGVIGAGASTSFRLYAQTGSYGYGVNGTSGWLDNNASALSSSGDTEYGPRTVSVLAPGDLGWADCSPNTTTFTGCADFYNSSASNPPPIVAFGGTSMSCPLTAGVAALVIQAYRNTHNGVTPSPQLVKQIISSTATDLHITGQNQGAGLVNALKAVQAAASVHDANGSPSAVGNGLLISPSSISKVAAPGQTSGYAVKVANDGSISQTLTPALRSLSSPVAIASGTLTLNPSTDPTFTYMTGVIAHDVHVVHFVVPSAAGRLVSRIAWYGSISGGGSVVKATLFDPSGRIAAYSLPQGPGSGFAENEVHDVPPGTWTLLIFDSSASPYSGPLRYAVTTQSFANVAGAVVPTSLSLAPGASGVFTVYVSTPPAPGDRAMSLVFNSSSGTARSTIPVTTRALVPVGGLATGSFNGVLTGGNARMPFYGQELVYQFNVPAGQPDINVNLHVATRGYQIFAFLVDPNLSPVDVQGSELFNPFSGTQTNYQNTHLIWARPIAGRWTLDITTVFGNRSLLTSVGIGGTINFSRPTVSAAGVPNGVTVPANVPINATIGVTNTGNAPAWFSLDPRLSQSAPIALGNVAANPPPYPLPITDLSQVPLFAVPPFSTHLDVTASATDPAVVINFDTTPAFGYPDFTSSVGNTAVASSNPQIPDVPASAWGCPPTEVLANSQSAVSTTFNCSGDATTNAYDANVSSSTGNVWSLADNLTSTYNPLLLAPGQSGVISVTFTPAGSAGTVTSGFLALETFDFNSFSSDVLVKIPYSYTVQ